MNKDGVKHSYTKAQKSLIRKSIIGLIIAVVLIASIYIFGNYMEEGIYASQQVRGDLSQNNGGIVGHDGQSYIYNERLLTILFIGIDRATTPESTAQKYHNGGQADFLMLMVIDPDAKTIKQIHIDRDSMTEITTVGVTGNVSGSREAQICLAHGFGDGKEQSCEFTVDAVEYLIKGIDIDFYIALNMDAIPSLNDAVGGVTVNINDDFTALDPDMLSGTEMKLSGQQALMFVQNRMDIGDGTSAARMNRHQEFFSGFAKSMEAGIAKDNEFVGSIFDIMGESITSNMNRGRMINEANKAIGYERGTVLRLEGEHTEGKDGFVRFYADEEALERLTIDTFYKKVQ